ncbi:MAG TPA: histidine kinase [Nitrolancea sp.]|nr:histidine kinase [Nitrolancea sp.]
MAVPVTQTKEFLSRLEALAEECRAELTEVSQSLQEIQLLLTQSQSEVDRLTQREMALNNRQREMESNIESYSRRDIKDMYHASHEVELRLMMMRGQVEQLQERQTSITLYQEKLRLLLELADTQLQVEHERNSAQDTRTRMLRRGPAEIPFAEVIQAQEDERLRVAQLVVDGPAQALANIVLRTEICERSYERTPETLPTELAELRRLSTNALRDTRRLLYELRPVVLRELGVVPTLRRYLNDLSRLRQVPAAINGPEADDKLPELLRVVFYRLVQQMISAAAADDDVTEIDVVVRYEDAQVLARVEVYGPDRARAQAIPRLLKDETVRRRIDQLTADLHYELTGAEAAHLTLVIPLA